MLKLLRNLFTESTGPDQPEISGKETQPDKFIEKKVSLQGDLAVITIENLMELMSHAALSGELCLSTPDNEAYFIIRNGALVFGHMENNFTRIGTRLVRSGYITPERLQECLKIHKGEGGKRRLGELLIEKQYVLQNHLEETVREQVRECFFQVLVWNQGTFTFCVNESPPEEDLILDERIDHLIIEGVVAMDQNS